MFVIVIHDWPEVTQELAQSLASVLGSTAYDARQRLVCRGPVVVSCLADSQMAATLQGELQNSGFNAFVVDVDDALGKRPVFRVQNFKFAENFFCCQEDGGREESVAYNDIKLILPAFQVMSPAVIDTVTKKKFSMGKTLMAGGLPMTKNVNRQEVVSYEDRGRVLYLCLANRTLLVCAQDRMAYECFGKEIKPTRELNFNYFLSEVRRHCPDAAYDDRLLTRAGQVKLLGPLLNPDSHIALAVDILAALEMH